MDATVTIWRRSMMETSLTTLSEAREHLRVAMRFYPSLDKRTEAFLASLHWRRRTVAELVFGQRLTIRDAAAQVARSEPTVERDLSAVCRAYKRFLQQKP